MSTPLVIAHRGSSGLRPEHTAEAYRLGYRQGADSVELDVVLSRDGVPVCRHDLDLGRTTDVASRPEFADRARQVRGAKGGVVSSWAVYDFTLEELRTLRARERWPRKRPESASYDGLLPLLTLEEVLDLRTQEEAMRGRPLGLHVELKEARVHESVGLCLEEAVLEVLERRGLNLAGSGITLMGFEKHLVQRLSGLSDLPRVVLLAKPTGRRELDRIAGYADAVGVHKDLVFPPGRRDPAEAAADRRTVLVSRAHERDLGVLVWTLRSENKHLPPQLRRGVRPRRHGDAAAEVRMHLDAGVDALITDFPEVAVGEVGRTPRRVAL